MNTSDRIPVTTHFGIEHQSQTDQVAIEEPLEIRLAFGPLERRMRATLGVTMRTPGHDGELAAGFLLAEGVIQDVSDLLGVQQVEVNAVRVELHPGVQFNAERIRLFPVTSACGVCGTRTLDEFERHLDPVAVTTKFPIALIHSLPGMLREAQPAFDATGGLHAAGLFNSMGGLRSVREDVGRHNAVDKLIGAELLAGRFPLTGRVIFVSGRAGFELVQKAVGAGAEMLAAVGAPTSLAVAAAKRFGLTLLGFVRDQRFNVYAGENRVV